MKFVKETNISCEHEFWLNNYFKGKFVPNRRIIRVKTLTEIVFANCSIIFGFFFFLKNGLFRFLDIMANINFVNIELKV